MTYRSRKSRGADGAPGSKAPGWKISPDADERQRWADKRQRGWQSPEEEQRAQHRAVQKTLEAPRYRPRRRRA